MMYDPKAGDKEMGHVAQLCVLKLKEEFARDPGHLLVKQLQQVLAELITMVRSWSWFCVCTRS